MPTPADVREHLENDLYGFLLPYALRSGVLGFICIGLNRLLGGTSPNLLRMLVAGMPMLPVLPPAAQDELVAERAGTPRASSLLLSATWGEAQRQLGWTRTQALFVSGARLLLWHWMQPMMYMLAFYAYSDLLGPLQFALGFVVLGREMLYFSVTGAGLLRKPTFLLFSPYLADWRDRTLYFAMPEKFVLTVCCSVRAVWSLAILAIFAADLCGVLALIIGLARHRMWPPLACGYVVTAVSFIPTLVFLAGAAWRAGRLGVGAPPTVEHWPRRG